MLAGFTGGLAKRVIACLDVRANDAGDLVVTKGDQYDVREKEDGGEVRNLGKPVQLCKEYYEGGADEVTFLNITGFRDFPLGDLPMLEARPPSLPVPSRLRFREWLFFVSASGLMRADQSCRRAAGAHGVVECVCAAHCST